MIKFKRFALGALAVAMALGMAAGCADVPEVPPDGGEEPGQIAAPEKFYYVHTDRQTYMAGEKVYITAGGSDTAKIGIYPADAGIEEASAVKLFDAGDYGRYAAVLSENMTAGEYKAVVSDGDVKAQTVFTVTGDAVFTNKDVYCSGEDIVVTAYSNGEYSWVGLYKAGESPSSTQSICWYYLQRDTHLLGQSYILGRTATYNKSRELEAGEYKVVLFGGDSTDSEITSKNITITSDELPEPQAPVSANYIKDKKESNLASGEFTVNWGDNNGYASEMVARWADGNGVLDGYNAFAPVKVYGKTIKYGKLDGVMIPEKATSLRLYGKNLKSESKTYLEVEIKDDRKTKKGKVSASFNVISDIHISKSATHDGKELYNTNFVNACNDITEVNPDALDVVIVGDIANSGLSSEWEFANKTLVNAGLNPYYALGNHDLYENNIPYDRKVKDFLNYSSQEKAYYEVEFAGFSHLFLGSQEQVSGGVDAVLLDDQITWLETRLKELTDENGGDKIFVYCHQSLYDTIAGSLKGQNWNGMRPDERVRRILAKYPNAIMFNGHSHWIMESYRNAYFATNEMSNVFNTSSVAYLWSTDDTEISVQGSQGYFIKIYKDAVYILGRDFVNSKWIPEACYKIDR